MENFTLHNPTRLIFGSDTVGLIGEEILARGIKKTLFLAGEGSIRRNGVYKRVVSSLKEAGVDFVEVWGVRPNPVLTKVQEAVRTAKEFRAEAVLGVGGGSVIDSAKLSAAGFYLEDIWSAVEGKVKIERALPIFTILTLSATGSEMNENAVVTNAEVRKKLGVSSPTLYPALSIVDPSIQVSLPWFQTVNGAIDAIAHVLEFYFRAEDQETALALDEALIRSIIKATDRLKENQGDYAARANLAWAATLALNGTSGATLKGEWFVHGLQHVISAFHPEVAHGAGLGVLFPAWIAFMQDYNPLIFKRWAQEIWKASSVKEGIEEMRQAFLRWGAPLTLGDLGVKEGEIPAIAADVYENGRTGKLKKLSSEEIESILRLAL